MKAKTLTLRLSAAFLLLAAVPWTGRAQEAIATLKETGRAFSRIAREAVPAVVFIQVEQTVEVDQPPVMYNNPFEFFFGRPFDDPRSSPVPPAPRRYFQEGQGSGFIISADGYILTNNHVVNQADKITVKLNDGRAFQAKLIGTDPQSEVALIKIEAENLPVLEPGNSDALEVGEWVLAVGNPFGLAETVTAGIVSAKERSMVGIADYENFIQTDAAINPGNSGGPLVNLDGKAVGINTAIYSRSGGYMGIGFAIPINMALNIKDQLIRDGKVTRSYLGVIIQPVDEKLAQAFGRSEAGGVLISQVLDDSAAAEAGLEPGDIVLELNGESVNGVGPFRNRIAEQPPGTRLELLIFRNNRTFKISVTTRARDESEDSPRSGTQPAWHEQLGLKLGELNRDLARRLGYEPDAEGVLITGVEQGRPAWSAGLRRGELIVSVNRTPVRTPEEFTAELRHADKKRILLFVANRQGARYVALGLE